MVCKSFRKRKKKEYVYELFVFPSMLRCQKKILVNVVKEKKRMTSVMPDDRSVPCCCCLPVVSLTHTHADWT